ncbi:hypothetical protein CSC94_17935 [Zhengella mangrovi]|uniref:Uncharacterized protein n=1 Tax=Zhengella mangrovi TaxID=1982044 RepID=A0A2G1QJT2_9HYPH|nr:hypothetical protein [Zhengella mangrovi]PHP65729.1 hypothetical protein CSC94_17935 [Zhengella mangrovi]
MKTDDLKSTRERIISQGIRDFIGELQMINPEYFVSFITIGMHASLEDLVNSCAELYFEPGFVKLGQGSSVEMSWVRPPKVTLDIELEDPLMTAFIQVNLERNMAKVRLNYIRFGTGHEDPERNTEHLAIAMSRQGRTAAMSR